MPVVAPKTNMKIVHIGTWDKALKAMRDGHKVAQLDWPVGHYMISFEGNLRYNAQRAHWMGHAYELPDVMATNWVIVDGLPRTYETVDVMDPDEAELKYVEYMI